MINANTLTILPLLLEAEVDHVHVLAVDARVLAGVAQAADVQIQIDLGGQDLIVLDALGPIAQEGQDQTGPDDQGLAGLDPTDLEGLVLDVHLNVHQDVHHNVDGVRDREGETGHAAHDAEGVDRAVKDMWPFVSHKIAIMTELDIITPATNDTLLITHMMTSVVVALVNAIDMNRNVMTMDLMMSI